MAVLRLLRAALLTGLAISVSPDAGASSTSRHRGERSETSPTLLAQVSARPGSSASATGIDPLRDQQTRLLQQRAAEQREAANQRLRAQREQQTAADRAQRQCGALDARASHLAAQSRLPPGDALAADRLQQERRMLRDDRRRMGCR